MGNEQDLEKYHEDYLNLKNDLGELLILAENTLVHNLQGSGIEMAMPIQKRVKEWESLKPKFEKKPYSYRGLRDVQDLSGMRVIVLFPRELDKIETVISKTFRVIKRYDKRWQLETDQFGYSSIHYVVTLDDDDSDRNFSFINRDSKIEIQLRTLSQHIWAEVSHKLQYKRESSVPDLIRRRLHRMSATLEGLDTDLEAILNERKAYRSGIVSIDSDEPLNIDLLAATLEHIWPIENKSEHEKYDYLLSYLASEGIHTQRQLSAILISQRENVLSYSARYAEWLTEAIELYPFENGRLKIEKPNRYITISNITPRLLERVRNGIYYSHVALTVTAVQYHIGERDPDEEPG